VNDDMARLTGAHAVNALTGAERVQFEKHLARCEDCAREVRELRETAAVLAEAAPQTPPEELKQRVLDEISRTHQVPAARGSAGPRALRWPRPSHLAAAACLALAAAFGGIAVHERDQLHETQRAIEAGNRRSAEIAEVMAAPDTKMMTAGGPGMNATTAMSKKMGMTVFMGHPTSAPPGEQVYQLWFIGNYGYRSAGVLPTGQGGTMAPEVAEIPPGTTAMGVTVEPPGGSPQPTGTPVVHMPIPA
jgi:anti-sigma-K factor RskA